MAKARPVAQGQFQEVLFVLFPDGDPGHSYFILDGRSFGGVLAALSASAFLPAEQVVPEAWRDAGFVGLINGAPHHLVRRPILDADFVQVGRNNALTKHASATQMPKRSPGPSEPG